MNQMFEKDQDLNMCLQECARIQLAVKRKLKDKAVLAKFTECEPILHNKTRWSGKYDTILKCHKMYDDSLQV